MDYLIKLADQLICIAACMLLGAFLIDIHSISVALATVSLIILIPCIVYFVIEAVIFHKFKQIKQQFKESNFFWAGYFLLVSMVLLNSDQPAWAIIFGILSLLHFVFTIYTIIHLKKAS